MKVLHIINNLGSGGAEKLLETTIPLMVNDYDIEVDVLLLKHHGSVFHEKILASGVNISSLQTKNIYNPTNIIKIKKHIKRNNYDIVHVHLFPTLYWVALASQRKKKRKEKYIVTEHNTHNRRRDIKALRPIEKTIYSRYDRIISISDSTSNNLSDWLQLNDQEKRKMVTIYNGVPISRFAEAEAYRRNEFISGLPDDSVLLCMIGSFSKQKDQGTIISALSKLPNNYHLILVGQGSEKNKLEQLSISSKVSDRVHFLGFRNDIERILKTIDIAIQSSHWEGFGLVAVEAMAAGKPVIASDVHGLSQVVNGAGLLFPPGDDIYLARQIIWLIEDKSNYEKVADNCFNRSHSYDFEEMVKKYIDLYKDETRLL